MPKIFLSLLFALVTVSAAQADFDYTKPVDLKFTALDGREVDLAKLRGKVVLIDFWATWCPPCRRISPDMVGFYKKYHDQGLEIIGISVDSDRKALAGVIKEEGLAWPQYCDFQGSDSAVAARFGIEQFPTLLLLDKKGMVVNKNLVELWLTDGKFDASETSPATRARVEAALEKQLAEK